MPGDPRNLFGGQVPEPPEYTSPLTTDAVSLHELFTTLRSAGFTELQASVILGTAIGVQSGKKEAP